MENTGGKRDERPEAYRAPQAKLGLRSDNASGVILICLGVFNVFNGVLGCVLGSFLRFVFLPFRMSLAAPPSPGFVQEMSLATHVQLLSGPPLAIVGIAFIVLGVRIRRGVPRARLFARIAVLAGLSWFVGCMVYALIFTFPKLPTKSRISPAFDSAMMTFSVVGNVVIVLVVVAFLLYILSQPKRLETPSPEQHD